MTGAASAPFEGANALIFGGAKGIGRAVALEWARRGASLAIADIDEAAADATAREIAAAGGRALSVRADVLSLESMESAVETVEGELGQIDIVMNNVGAILNGHPLDIPMAEWHRIFELNYFAIVRSNTIFLPKMLGRGSGHIVNTASFAGLYPYAAGRIPYASAKAAVISLSENLALIAEPEGVRVCCLIPGPTMTTIADGMKNLTPGLPMYAGGSETTLILPEQLAVTLADGMRDGRVLIPADEVVWAIVRRHAANPDKFLHEKIAAFTGGDYGSPTIPEDIIELMKSRR